jgi:hypothetical protein
LVSKEHVYGTFNLPLSSCGLLGLGGVVIVAYVFLVSVVSVVVSFVTQMAK